MASSSSMENTVFVKFVPPSPEITRFHLQDYFSQVGPIRKCSVIQDASHKNRGFGFVKFISGSDAEAAARSENGKRITLDNKTYKLTVELASSKHKTKTAPDKKDEDHVKEQPANDDSKQMEDSEELVTRRKRTCRVIVRNVSFYANEQHIRRVLEQEYGPVVEVTLPRVSPKLHRGFCFVTFQEVKDAKKAVQPRSSPLLIKKRPVAIDYSVSKHVHQQLQKQQQQRDVSKEDSDDDDDNKEEESSDDDDDDDDDSSSDEENDGGGNDDSEDSSEEEEDDGESSDDDSEQENDDELKKQKQSPGTENLSDTAVADHRSLFIRNLPFDATRHDMFELFRRFGHIQSIYLVKDKATGMPKGTAFVSYAKPEAAKRALEAAGDNDFVAQRQGSSAPQEGLHLQGRRLFVNVAVDKSTAASMDTQEKVTGKDRRNLYLKLEGRVAQGEAWETLPESDQFKRQRAFGEKSTKLQSPLFFINPHRLSIRNLAKHVDEAMLKKLCVVGIQRGLALVSKEDQVAHWRAGGEITTRDILKRMQEDEGNVIPDFDEHNVKMFIPSVFIDRDFDKAKKGPSRGFGFVEFQHHVHALACLRELNNNPFYSVEYVAGGKRAADLKKKSAKKKKTAPSEFVSEEGRSLTPRLIVDFVVENKAKARKQAEHRAQQQANYEKQRIEQKEKKHSEGVASKKKKKSRGAIQREKKRKQKEVAERGEDVVSEPKAATAKKGEKRPPEAMEKAEVKQKAKKVKPAKKRKVDKEEQNFDKLVESYRQSFSSIPAAKDSTTTSDKKQDRSKVVEKRWFE